MEEQYIVDACPCPPDADAKRVMLEITRKCNAFCKHCCTNSSANHFPNELSSDEIIKYLSDFRNRGFNQVYITGGEPLLKGGFCDIIQHASKIGLEAMFSTNGSLVNEKIIDALARTNVSFIGVSLDSYIPEKHDEFRGLKGLWKSACRGIKLMAQVGLPMRIMSVVTQSNRSDLEGLVNLCEELGAKYIRFQNFIPLGRGAQNARSNILTKSETEDVTKTLVAIREKYDGRVKVAFRRDYQDGSPFSACRGGNDLICVDSLGNVSVCPWLYKHNHYWLVGNLRQNSLGELLENGKIPLFRSAVALREKRRMECLGCTKDCGLGCLLLPQLAGESLLNADTMCTLASSIEPGNKYYKRYIITGAPGYGKTTLLNALENVGLPVRREVARDIIKEFVKLGIDIRKNQETLSKSIAERQLRLWSTLPATDVFVESSPIDGIAFAECDGYLPSAELLAAAKNVKADAVFLIERPSERYNRGGGGSYFTEEKAASLQDAMERAYAFYGHAVISVPAESVENRARFVINSLIGMYDAQTCI